MFSCCSELNETPFFCLEQVDLSSCLLLLEEKLAKKKPPAEWQKPPCVSGRTLHARVCVYSYENSTCQGGNDDRNQRKVSLALTLRAPAGLLHVFPWEVVLRSLWSVLKSEFEAAPGCRERLLGAAVGAALPAVPHPCWGQCWA